MKRLLMVIMLVSWASTAHAALKPGDVAPAFSLRDAQGNDFFLSDVVGEKARKRATGVIVSFFASWCTPCRKELPLINSLTHEFTAKGIIVVLVGLKEDFDVISSLLAELHVDKPVILSDRYGKVAEKYQVRFLPTTFYISADGKIRDIDFGEIRGEKELRESVGKILK